MATWGAWTCFLEGEAERFLHTSARTPVRLCLRVPSGQKRSGGECGRTGERMQPVRSRWRSGFSSSGCSSEKGRTPQYSVAPPLWPQQRWIISHPFWLFDQLRPRNILICAENCRWDHLTSSHTRRCPLSACAWEVRDAADERTFLRTTKRVWERVRVCVGDLLSIHASSAAWSSGIALKATRQLKAENMRARCFACDQPPFCFARGGRGQPTEISACSDRRLFVASQSDSSVSFLAFLYLFSVEPQIYSVTSPFSVLI